ncbi:mannose-1-phosphate guanylyltransferase [Dehalogenimonas formicexedens]|uniref:Mannose-1-phosphate guanylyltransferase n=1 Tax=Dehalogenimonas formicexedens TaxID=1839801 RepID=A0A1P8F7W8_9CHLR|nr:NDP-sugar synthase [Dehalogenimonas formicexedens]APV44523.1 mannose-1-phosphate guanylyltransferase [Dehalogenimonas formicexedens]
MKALILVGGLGTRLRPLTINTPKAMMPVLNKPFMAHVVDHLMGHGVDEVIFTRGHLAGQMERYFGENYRSCKVTFIDEEKPLGTAGGIKNCERFLDSTFFALNGDVFSTIDLSAMLAQHRSNNAVATIALTPVENPSAFGLVETEKDNQIRRFIEKPRAEEITTDLINAGCYILEPEIFGYIEPGKNTSIERETFQFLLTDHRPFYAFVDRNSYWIDMGNCEKYFQFNMDMLNGRCQCPLTPPAGTSIGDGTFVDPSAVFAGNVMVGRGCSIGPGVRIEGPVIIGDRCAVGNNTVLRNSIVWENVEFSPDDVVTGSIIAGRSRLGGQNRISDSTLADGVYTPSDYSLSGSQIWPGTALSN